MVGGSTVLIDGFSWEYVVSGRAETILNNPRNVNWSAITEMIGPAKREVISPEKTVG
jgi:hypothetical protein